MKTLKALFWGCVTGAALAYIFGPRRVDLLRASNGIGAQPSTGSTTTLAATTSGAFNAQTATAENAAFVGNTHTRVYHSVTDSNLPSEEHRAYFATAEDAEAAGYQGTGQTTSA
jgi:hypothetical protein